MYNAIDRCCLLFCSTVVLTVSFGQTLIPNTMSSTGQHPLVPYGSPPLSATANAQMQAVLDELDGMGGKPIEGLSALEARLQPTPADAVRALLKKQGRPTAPEAVGKVEDRTFPGPGGEVSLRIYTPRGEGPFPVVLYIHGGGWVIADLDAYDSSPRALCNAASAIIVSTHYRQAPEHPYPAAHEDTYAAYKWLCVNAGSLNGDAKRIALVGESAGGNMAASISLRSLKDGSAMPVHQVLIYPVTNDQPGTPSMLENMSAKPLNTPMLAWFFKNAVPDPTRVDLSWLTILKQPVQGSPSTTMIFAEIDPLRSEGEAFANHLREANVPVSTRTFSGVTHEFFGMGAVVDEAKEAVQFAAQGLMEGFVVR